MTVASHAHRWRRLAVGPIALLLGGLLSCSSAESDATDASPPAETATAQDPATETATAQDPATETAMAASEPPMASGTAREALDSLAVKGRAPKTGYSREAFGRAWADVDRNGCDTRNDILNRDLTAVTWKPGSGSCTVLTGNLADPYTGTQIAFRRGQGTSTAVQIDHVVALSDAWQKGAQAWAKARRTEFANDPLELLAVNGPANQAKGDGDAATWQPPNRDYRCAYATSQVVVKAKYGLWVTAAEHAALARNLATCPGEALPTATPSAAPTP